MEILGIWLALCLIPAYIASQKDRSPVGFFLLSVVLTPLLGAAIALIISPGPRVAQRPWPTAPSEAGYQAPDGSRCGRCGKNLSPAWRDKCKHCGARYAEFAPVHR